MVVNNINYVFITFLYLTDFFRENSALGQPLVSDYEIEPELKYIFLVSKLFRVVGHQ